MFSIDKRSSFSLKPPEFSCDQPIHKQIVPPLPCTPFFLTITGSAGSGKTSMLVNLLTSPQAYKKAFHAVHCIIPAHSVASLKKNIFAKHPRMHDELNFATLDRIYEQVMKNSEEKMSSPLIMDDVTASLKNLEIQMLLKKIIFNRRHYRLSIICLVNVTMRCHLLFEKQSAIWLVTNQGTKKRCPPYGRSSFFSTRRLDWGGPPTLCV